MASKILAIMHHERDKVFRGRLQSALGKKKGRSISTVQVETDNGEIEEHTIEQLLQDTIFWEIN